MSEFNLGTARGRIVVDSDTRGVGKAKAEVAGFEKQTKTTAPHVQKLEKGIGLLAAGAGVGVVAGFALAVKSAASFEKGISAIGAVTGASGKEMDLLRKKALQIGKDTAFSASEAASAMEELAKAGISTTDILSGAADATVALAAAGEVALPEAATIAANAMNAFGLSAKEMPRVADLIAGAANASAIDVSEFGQSLQQAGAVAHLAGVPFSDLAVAIAEMGNAGIKGSDAGTSLKTMLQNLNPSTAKQKTLMKELGIVTKEGANQFFDATGKAKGLGDISQVLQNSLKGMTKQQKLATLEVLFGSDAIRAAAILADNGSKGFDKLAGSMDKIKAADVAKQRLNNLMGDIEQLKGSLETLAITIGEKAQPALRFIAQAATRFVNAITEFKVPPALASFGTTILKSISNAFGGILRGARDFGSRLIATLIASFDPNRAQKEFQDRLSKVGPVEAKFLQANINPAELTKGADWSGLGASIATGILTAFRGIKDFGTMILDWIKSVNWLEVGKKASDAAVPFIIGFLNQFVQSIIDFAIHHPMDMLLFIVSIIPIGRVGGIVAKILEKLPFLRMFAPLFKGLRSVTKPITDVIERIFGFLGKSFLEGFTRMFPGVGGAIRRFLDGIALRFLYGIDALRNAAIRVFGGFFEGMGEMAGQATRDVGRFIGWITSPFRKAGGWLVRRGVEAVGGLLRGIRSMVVAVTRTALDVINWATLPYRRAGSWLLRRGAELVGGLLRGIRSLVGAVTRTALDIIATLLRPYIASGRWLIGRGREVVDGLIRGARAMLGLVGRAAGEVRDRFVNTFRTAGRFLVDAGRNIIRGLIGGAREVLRNIGGFLSEIKDTIVNGIKRLFGIRSPASVMVPLGKNILRGLLKGMLSGGTNLRRVLETIGGSITGFFKQLLSGGLPGIAVDLVKDLLSSGAKGISFLGELLGGLGGKALDIFGGVGSSIAGFFKGLIGGGGLPNFAALGKSMAASLFGWVGPEWNALFQLGMGESGWSNTAQNPDSTAFGIGQFLDSTWALVGMVKTLDPAKQILGFLKYIKLIYGDPIHAFGAWLSRVPHWYDKGGVWPSGVLGLNMSGKDEFVFTQDQLAGFGGSNLVIESINISGMKDAAAVEQLMKKRSTWDVLIQSFRQKRKGS